MTWKVRVPKALGPLQELEIVLHLAFCETLNRYSPLDRMSSKRVLENLEVLYVGVFGVDVEFDSAHRHVEEDGIVHLT